VSDHLFVVPADNLEPSCDQIQSRPLHSSSPHLLTLSHPFELLLKGMDSGLEVLVSPLLGAISLHLSDESPWPHMSHFPQQFVIEIGGAGEELVQPGLEGLYWHHVFVILHFFICIGVGKYFFDKGGVTGGAIAREAHHHSSRKELDPVGLFPDIFLEGEHEVGSPLGVVLEVSFRPGMVGSLVLSEPCCKFLQSFISHLVSMLILL
jgi:hypothetical protein